MSDQSGAIPLGLAQQQAARNIDPEQLEAMGKRAAALYSERGSSLNEAVVETVKEARLAPEQVKRVCEFANTAAYIQEFEKGGEVRNVTFQGGPADPSVVLKDLNDGSSPPPHQVKTAAYQPPKGHYKIAMADDVLADAFGARSGMMKTASADHFARATSGDEIADLKTRLDGVRDDLMSKLSSSGVLFEDVKAALCEATRQEVLDGSSLGDVVTAWSSFSPSTPMLKEAMSLVSGYLQATGDMTKEAQVSSLNKTANAGKVPNPDHPAVDRFIAFTKIAFEHRKLQEALSIVDEQLVDVNRALKEMA